MTIDREQAIALGYIVEKAGLVEVGLCLGDDGIRTWWCKEFDHMLPDIGHPIILAAIERNEQLRRERTETCIHLEIQPDTPSEKIWHVYENRDGEWHPIPESEYFPSLKLDEDK